MINPNHYAVIEMYFDDILMYENLIKVSTQILFHPEYLIPRRKEEGRHRRSGPGCGSFQNRIVSCMDQGCRPER